MSFNGIMIFERNLRELMNSDAYKRADEGQRLDMRYRLFRSKYGVGSWFGFGRVHVLSKSKVVR